MHPASQFVHEIVMTALMAIAGAVAMWPINQAKKAWKNLTAQLTHLQTELEEQRTNCLETLQQQGEKQIELLGTANTILTKMHDSQLEMTGYLRGRHEKE
jgi:hypothetical protein